MIVHREDICAATETRASSGFTRGASGNFAIRDGDNMPIAPSGSPPYDISRKHFSWMALAADEVVGGSAGAVFRIADPRRYPEGASGDECRRSHPPARMHGPCGHEEIHPCDPLYDRRLRGSELRCSAYGIYGPPEPSAAVLEELKDCSACLVANPGMLVAGEKLTQPLWFANELEALANQYFHSLLISAAHVLSDAPIEEVARGSKFYGAEAKEEVA